MLPLHDDQPTRLRPWVTVSIIICCLATFLWQLSLSETDFDRAVFSLGMIPSVLIGPHFLPTELWVVPSIFTVITSMFLHGGWLHLLGNMLYLWIFGNNVEDSMGHARFLAFYLICGACAALAQAYAAPMSDVPMIGASGAVAGTLGAYLLLHPRARILTFVFLGIFWTFIRLPAVVVLGGWIALQFVNAIGTQPDTSGVAWLAHIGGFLSGIMLIGVFKYRTVKFFGRSRSGPWGKS